MSNFSFRSPICNTKVVVKYERFPLCDHYPALNRQTGRHTRRTKPDWFRTLRGSRTHKILDKYLEILHTKWAYVPPIIFLMMCTKIPPKLREFCCTLICSYFFKTKKSYPVIWINSLQQELNLIQTLFICCWCKTYKSLLKTTLLRNPTVLANFLK